MLTHLRKIAHILASEFLSTTLTLRLIGALNRMSRYRLNTVFIYYAANKRFLDLVTYESYARRFKWVPRFISVFVHHRGGGIACGIAATEADFIDINNTPQLRAVEKRARRIANLIGAQYVSYAGILPPYIARAGINREPIESLWISKWIIDAIETARITAGYGDSVPIVVLGACGFTGSKVVLDLLKQNRSVIEIDPKHHLQNHRSADLLHQLRGQPLLLVNIARDKTIDAYVEYLWPGVVIVNEVYPPADPEILAKIKNKGARYMHLKGVEGIAIPPFHGPYRGAIPCCAASAAEYSETITWASDNP